MRLTFSLTALLFCCFLQAQHRIEGVVLDSESGKPIRGASVFLNNTQKGVISDVNGQFHLDIGVGQYELVISMSGYKPLVKNIVVTEAIKDLTFRLVSRYKILEEVIVRDDCRKVRWKQYGQLFTDNFIGVIPNAQYCQIKNSGDILLMYCENAATLLAFAEKPIKITNKALGYDVDFTLERFELDLKKAVCNFRGMILFRERKGVGDDEKIRRSEAFQGSTRHFFRALFEDSLTSNGFTVFQKKQKFTAEEQKRINLDPARASIEERLKPQYLVEEESFDTSMAINLKKFMVNENKIFKELYWDRDLLVKYKTPQPFEEMYVNTLLAQLPTVREYRSKVAPVERSVFIDANGSHAGLPRLSGDFGKREVVANMLPIDYQPQ